MDAFVAAIRPGLHNMFTLELTYNGQSVQIPNQLTIKDALFELAKWCVKNDIDISTLKPKKCSFKVYQTKKGKFEVRQHTNGKNIYVKTFEKRDNANRFIEGNAIIEQSIMNDLKRENTQLQQEIDRLRTALEKALNQIPSKGMVNEDVLIRQSFGSCSKCGSPWCLRHNTDGVPFLGCSTYEYGVEGTCKGRYGFKTMSECVQAGLSQEDRTVWQDDKDKFVKTGTKKGSSKKTQKLGSEFDDLYKPLKGEF